MAHELSIPAPAPKPNGGQSLVIATPQAVPPAVLTNPQADRFRGVSEKRLTPEAYDILCAPVKDEEVSRRSHDDMLYVAHAHYRHRLTKAVGPGAWALVKDSEPVYDATECMVYWSGTLYILGQYISSSVGGCRYTKGKSGKGQMNYADCVEGAKSDCLTRCSKDLGMFWELWDPNWRAGYEKRMRSKPKPAPAPATSEAEPLIVPDTSSPAQILESISIGDKLTLEGHGCPTCTLNVWIVAEGSAKSKNPGRWYIHCAKDGCVGDKGYPTFGGWWEEVKAKYATGEAKEA